jgi:hypothetical protein
MLLPLLALLWANTVPHYTQAEMVKKADVVALVLVTGTGLTAHLGGLLARDCSAARVVRSEKGISHLKS